MKKQFIHLLVACGLGLTALVPGAVAQATPPMTPDIPPKFNPPEENFDYTVRKEMIPMRDGVKLFTVIVIPKGAHDAPMILERTPYNAGGRVHETTPHELDALPMSDSEFVSAGYIRVYQDVRGKYGSEGEYVMTPPPTGPLNPNGPNDTKDAYDTIDWLVKHVPESNGRVGMIGSSYDGFTVTMALLDPHPALKAAVPESPMVDGWMGDDWFHYGAFREINLDYFRGQTAEHGGGFQAIPREGADDYTNFLRAGSAGDFARAGGLEQLPFWKKVEEHPAYDAFWQGQALNDAVAKLPLKVPTIWLQGLWDQEDMWGAIHCYEADEPKDRSNNMNYLVMGPWRHSQVNAEGRSLGPMRWNGDTTEQFRRDYLVPFFNQYLKDNGAKADTPPVLIYNTGENHWDKFNSWPLSCDSGCASKPKPIYFSAGGKLSFQAPEAAAPKFDEYVSDPAHPVPYRPRPVDPNDGEAWHTWLLKDQRFVDGRPDVLTYETEPLTSPVRVSGRPIVNLYASTSGTDSDWAVKLIDVYPDAYPTDKSMEGYQLSIALDIFRGRYRTSFEHPEAITPNEPLLYKFGLPTVNHVFLPGHRIMVQVQSTLFPLYAHNPQKFVPNIFDAKPGDYQKATQRVWHTPGNASMISLPVVEAK